MLELNDVTVRFGETTAVDSVSLVVDEGSVLAVLGPSGCGKSTLLRAIAGLEHLDGGRVRWDGRDLAGVPTHERGFALMFQDGQLFAHASVAENIAYPLKLRRLGRAERARRVSELLELVGLPGYGDRRPTTLSGGEQQRVALARSLAAEPALLLLDEPLSALDRSLRDRLAGDLREILVETGTTALMVTHDHDEAFTVADRMAVMLDGRIAQEGDTVDVWRAPVSRQVAEFIGYETFLEAEAASRLDGGAEAVVNDASTGLVALRRSALRVDDDGPLTGIVRRAVSVSDAVHLQVQLDGIGEVSALAQDPVHHPGDQVRLRVDRRGLAQLLLPAAQDAPLSGARAGIPDRRRRPPGGTASR